MGNAPRDAGVVARRIQLVVAIDRLLVRLLEAAPGRWAVKGGYTNQLRRPDDARFTEDLDLRIDAAIETAPELLASGFAVDLADDFSYEVAASPATLDGPPGGSLRFVVVARLGGTELDSGVSPVAGAYPGPMASSAGSCRPGEVATPWCLLTSRSGARPSEPEGDGIADPRSCVTRGRYLGQDGWLIHVDGREPPRSPGRRRRSTRQRLTARRCSRSGRLRPPYRSSA